MQITNIKVMDGREWIRRNMGEYREEDGEQKREMPNLVDKNNEKRVPELIAILGWPRVIFRSSKTE